LFATEKNMFFIGVLFDLFLPVSTVSMAVFAVFTSKNGIIQILHYACINIHSLNTCVFCTKTEPDHAKNSALRCRSAVGFSLPYIIYTSLLPQNWQKRPPSVGAPQAGQNAGAAASFAASASFCSRAPFLASSTVWQIFLHICSYSR